MIASEKREEKMRSVSKLKNRGEEEEMTAS
jgi:hypothetical protein